MGGKAVRRKAGHEQVSWSRVGKETTLPPVFGKEMWLSLWSAIGSSARVAGFFARHLVALLWAAVLWLTAWLAT
jgi:hypothetical protein